MFRNPKALTIVTLALALSFLPLRPALALVPADLVQLGAAFMTHLSIHETGHYVMGHMGGAQDVQLDFFTQKNNSFFLGLSTAQGIDRDASLSYKMGGEAASSYLFEVALREYRYQPTAYNRALLFFSGTDFLWYSIWSFYVKDENNPAYDPVGISQETGLSPHAIVGAAFLQTALNAYRTTSGSDRLVPYINLDQSQAEMGIQFRF